MTKLLTQPTLITTRALIRSIPTNTILFLQRADGETSNPGFWEFPGGKSDHGESLEEGLIREVMEETGLIITDVGNRTIIQSKILTQETCTRSEYIGHLHITVTYLINTHKGKITLSEEHQKWAYLTPNQISMHQVTPACRYVLENL